jgi:hypothetical protein
MTHFALAQRQFGSGFFSAGKGVGTAGECDQPDQEQSDVKRKNVSVASHDGTQEKSGMNG